MKPLELLFERGSAPDIALPSGLAALYPGRFRLPRPGLYANLVSSVDGVVSLPSGGESGRIVSGDNEADHFVMALLRACADAVVIGANTFRRAPGDLWHPGAVYPAGRELFADLRRERGLRPEPLLVVVSASGILDTGQPALRDALIATTEVGKARLRDTLPPGARLAAFGDPPLRMADLLKHLHEEGFSSILTEGGPSLLGQLLKEELVDDLFLTVSPKLFGRTPEDGVKSLVDGVDLEGLPLDLASAHRHGSHLFLRYALGRQSASPRGSKSTGL